MVVFRAAGSFEESLVTWESQPSVGATPVPALWEVTGETGWTTAEVTALVADCWQNRGGQCVWQVRRVDEGDNALTHQVRLRSRESAEMVQRPYLEVVYELP